MNDPLNWINRRTSAVGLLAGILLGAGWFTVPATMIAAMAPDSSPRQVLQQAKALEDEKRYEEAIAAYRQYLLSKPDHDDVRATMAKLLSWQGQRDEAIALYREILTRQPLDHDNRVGLARVLSWNKQFADARDEYERVLHDEPTHVEALVGMGDLLVWSGHREQAIPYYERAVAATGDEEIAARLRDVKAEVESIPAVPDPSATRRSTSEPTDGSQVLERGRRLETMRQPEDALAVYREGLRQFPEHDELRTAMARLLSWQGAHAEAVELYRDALARHPKDQDIRVALAQVLSWQKQFDEADRLYQDVLLAQPTQTEARRGLAEVAHWRGDRSDALQRYEALLAETHDPDMEERVRAIRSEMQTAAEPAAEQSAAGSSTPEEGLRAVASAMERATRFEVAKQYREAEGVYREALQQHPENDEIRSALARVLSWQGSHGEATTLYRDVLGRHPEDQDIRVALAQVLAWQKQFDEADRLYRDVLLAEPTQMEARRGLAEVAHWRGDRSDALQRYEALLAETHDPSIAQRIEAVKSELLVSPRAAVGQGLTGLRLPYRDYAKIGYGHYSYTKNQPDERDLLFEVAKPLGNQTLVLRVEPINRFGFHDTPVSAELYSPLWRRAWGYVAAQGTVNPNFSPNYSVMGEVAQGLGGLHASLAPFELSFGYRRLNYKQDDIDLLMPGLTVFLPFNLWLTEKIYLIPNTGAITLSSQLTWRPTERVQVFASGSFGTSGERIVAAQDFTRVGSRTIQAGITFPINERFSAETSAYYEDRGFLYVRRGGNFSVIYHW
ncbi:MAG: tetratricopeptide repeat protein [Nitrospira sp.]|jgi:YaiO family outer membrane protein|nr:tetratricopeptide repeat protein [Nitrospira sp.]MBP6264625.1 tetratricopeptide repeat protein [Nitrospira sp.]MBP6605697.1 tetratricopeptide repeat protein [Nitrospira sp.]HNV26576.1 tetratricopeptide repeat protein [Nitrospira sp.]